MPDKAKPTPRVRVNGVVQPYSPEWNFTGAGITVTRNGKVAQLNIPGGSGGVPGTDPTVYALANQMVAGVGIHTFNLLTPGLAGLARSNMFWMIEPWTENCERLPVYDVISSQAFLSGTGFDQDHTTLWFPYFTHPAGSRIVVLTMDDMTPMLYGAKGDGVTDDWAAIQRTLYNLGLQTIYGGSPTREYRIRRPLTVPDESRSKELALLCDVSDFVAQTVQTNVPTDAPHSGIYSVSERSAVFDVVSPGTAILIRGPGTLQDWNPKPIRLTSFFHGQMPSGIVEGRYYALANLTLVGSDIQANVCELATPTTPIAMGIGKGYAHFNWGSHIHNFTDGLTIRSNVPDLDLMQIIQYNQPSRSRDLVTKALATSGSETAAMIAGQLSDHTNVVVELGPGGAKTGVVVFNVGDVIDQVVVTTPLGDNPAAVGVVVSGINQYIGKVDTDGVGTGVLLNAFGNATVDQVHYRHAAGGVGAVKEAPGQFEQSWQVNRIQCEQLNVPILVLAGGLVINTWDGNPISGVGETDEHGVFPGIYKPGGDMFGYVLLNRIARSWTPTLGSTVFKMRRIYKALVVNSALNCDVWLANMGGFDGMEAVIHKTTGSNTLKVRDQNGVQIGSDITAAGLYRYIALNGWKQVV
jgi:hypothetical protein